MTLFFDETTPIEPETTEEQVLDTQEPEVIQNEEPEAKAEPETPEPTQKETPREDKEPHQVPLKTYLDTRDELKEYKRRLAEYEKSTQQKVETPDFTNDPASFQNYILGEQRAMMNQLRIEMEYENMVKTHGAEEMETVRQWAVARGQQDPAFNVAYENAPRKIEFIRNEYLKSQMLEEYNKDPEGWIRSQYQRLEGNNQAQQVARAPARTAPPVPSSTLSMTSKSKAVAETPANSIDALFPKSK